VAPAATAPIAAAGHGPGTGIAVIRRLSRRMLPLLLVAPSTTNRTRALDTCSRKSNEERSTVCTCHCVVLASIEPARRQAVPSQTCTEVDAKPLALRRAATPNIRSTSPSVRTSSTNARPF